MLLLTYISGDALGCINLEKTKTILFVELRTKSIEMVVDEVTHHFPLSSIFSSIGADGKDISTNIEEIITFEKENDLTNGMYETSLPQLIMLYIAKQPKIDFFSFVKKEYMEYKNAKVEEAINSLPD